MSTPWGPARAGAWAGFFDESTQEVLSVVGPFGKTRQVVTICADPDVVPAGSVTLFIDGYYGKYELGQPADVVFEKSDGTASVRPSRTKVVCRDWSRRHVYQSILCEVDFTEPPGKDYGGLWDVKVKCGRVHGSSYYSMTEAFWVVPFEIDGYVCGDWTRPIRNMVARSRNADANDDVRVVSGGHVRFAAAALLPRFGHLFSYQWSVTEGMMEADSTRQDVNWDAPTTETDTTVALVVSGEAGVIRGLAAKVKSVRPRVVRVKFVDDGTGKIITLKDAERNADIEAPQYDRLDTTWETAASHEAEQGYHTNEEGHVFKNESAAYVRGACLRVEADLAATDLPTGTAAELKHLSARTPVRLALAGSSPDLTFEGGPYSEVDDWSAEDFGPETRFTSNEPLGEAGPKIRFYWEAVLKWTVEVSDMDGEWVNALGGESTWDTTHRSLCVANAKAVKPPYPEDKGASSVPFEKVMQWSCDWAKEEGEPAKIVEKIWAGIDADLSDGGARVDLDYELADVGGWNTYHLLKAGKGSRALGEVVQRPLRSTGDRGCARQCVPS